MARTWKAVVSVAALGLTLLSPLALARAGDEKRPPVILATTTSTQDSGLLDELVPAFERESGWPVKTISVGSGQAIALGRRGEADVLLVHSADDEKKLVEEGSGVNRRLVMHNDFVVVGPPGDPARIKGATSTREAFGKVAAAGATFFSRGDNSGTHAREKALWRAAGVVPVGRPWYRETGLGMGDTLNVASEKGGYTLADRGTWLARNAAHALHLEVLVQGEPLLLNVYHVIEVNPARWPKVNAAGGKAFADFVVSEKGQAIIRAFGVARLGSPLFVPDAGKKPEALGL